LIEFLEDRVMTRTLSLALLLSILITAPSQAAYHLLRKIPLGGDGGWDYVSVDADAHRVYIARSTRVMVVDEETGKLIAEIPNTPRVHGVALVPKLGRGFITTAGDSSVAVFDLKTLAVTGRVRAGLHPDAILYDPSSERVYAMNAGGNSITVIDAATTNVVGTVELKGGPEAAVVDTKGHLFVNLEDSSAVQVVDTKTLASVGYWPLSPGTEPTGIALDEEHHRLFSNCADSMMVILDSANGKIVKTLPTGRGVDGAAFDSETHLAFSPNGAGTLTVVHEESADAFKVREDVPTQMGARTMALDPKTHHVFLVTALFTPPPAPTPDNPHPRRGIVPGSFVLLEFGE
jgi:YVTN family beta-propeller protein